MNDSTYSAAHALGELRRNCFSLPSIYTGVAPNSFFLFRLLSGVEYFGVKMSETEDSFFVFWPLSASIAKRDDRVYVEFSKGYSSQLVQVMKSSLDSVEPMPVSYEAVGYLTRITKLTEDDAKILGIPPFTLGTITASAQRLCEAILNVFKEHAQEAPDVDTAYDSEDSLHEEGSEDVGSNTLH